MLPSLFIPSEQVSNKLATSEQASTSPLPTQHLYATFCCEHCGHEVKVPVYCGNRFCAECGKRRRAKIRNRLRWILEQVKLDKGQRFKHIVLTIRSEQDPGEMTKRLVKAFRNLRQRKTWKTAVVGGSFVIELTHNEAGWHSHLHIIAQASFLDWYQIRKDWMQITGATGVWIENIPPQAALTYLTKYLTKPSVAPEQLADANLAMKGMRLMQPFGTWHGISLTYTEEPTYCPKCGSPTSNYSPIFAFDPGRSFFTWE